MGSGSPASPEASAPQPETCWYQGFVLMTLLLLDFHLLYTIEHWAFDEVGETMEEISKND